MDSSRRGLTDLQAEVLEAFAGCEDAWLTGGAALSGFHLGHRLSHDLDLFTQDPEALPQLRARLASWASLNGASLQVLRRFPGFERLLVVRDSEQTLVDLVLEQTHQVVPLEHKPLVNGLRVDPCEEIRANKLSALLGRSETKDLLDLYALARKGLEPLAGLAAARLKDGGLDPATLAWVLSSLRIDLEGLLLLEPVDQVDLQAFRDQLVESLQQQAWPTSTEEE